MKWLVVLGGGLVTAAIMTTLWFVVFTRTETPGETRHLIPSDLTARLIEGGETVEISWTAVDVEGLALIVQRSESGDEGTWIDLAQFESGTAIQTYTEPRIDTDYAYRIRASHEDGSSGQTAPVTIESP